MTDSQAKPTETSVSAKEVLELSRPERWLLVPALFLRLCAEASGLVTPLILVQAYEVVALNYGQINTSGDETRAAVAQTFILVLIVHFAGNAAGFLAGVMIGAAGERVIARLRLRLFKHILSQDMSFFDQRKSGDLVSRLGSDTTLVQLATTQSINEATVALVKVISAIALMFITSWELTLIVFGTIVLYMCLVVGPLTKIITRITKRYQDALGRGAATSTEVLGAMRTVRSFASEAVEEAIYSSSIGDATRWWPRKDDTTFYHGVKKALYSTALVSSGFTIVFGALQVSLWVGFVLITYERLTFGYLTAFQAYQFQIVFGAGQLAGAFFQLAQAKGGADRIFELLRLQPQLANTGGGLMPEDARCRGEIHFQDVGFAYPTREDVKVLEAFSLHVSENTTTALVGSSGCGKSTVLGLLLRFYHPSSGTITLDGRDISALDPRWLRGHMAYVQQEPLLFGRSLKENICYGLAAREKNAQSQTVTALADRGAPETFTPASTSEVVLCTPDQSIPSKPTASQQRIDDACKLANAHAFISEFAEGYDTLVGERGVRLSGGQKQRIAIARALLTEPRVLLLDEATSALDSESEALVQDAIERASSGRTVMVVAHRLSTVIDAHQIALVGRGGVVDAGTHEAMLQRCEPYLALVKRQLGGGASESSLSKRLDALG